MSASEELRRYLRRLHAQLRFSTVLRGCAVVAAAALGATLALVVIANRYAFSAHSLLGARLALIAVLAGGVAAALAVPLIRLTRRRSIARAERVFPAFGQRLSTFAERDGTANQLVELLAQDSLRLAAHQRRSIVPAALLAALAGAGVVSLAALVWLIRSGPGYLGYGASLLWTGPSRPPLYDLRVTPGDVTVRRHADLVVAAEPVGMKPSAAYVHVRYHSGAGWERTAMQAVPQSGAFRYLFAAVPEDAEYFVEMGALTSAHFRVHAADIPTVRQIRATYHYPSWTGVPERVEEHAGDLSAVQGSEALLEVLTDEPLQQGALVLEDGRTVPLTPAGAPGADIYRATLAIDRDATYHVTTMEERRPVRISEDYFIQASDAKPPEVAIVRPGGEYQASPIEEVTIGARAGDEFGLRQFTLRYSVNGGPEQSVNLLKGGGREASGSATLHLEDLKLVPGDVVSVYAQARDARAEGRSPMMFVEAQPFEREFSQSQQRGGGGGGAANDQAEISRREKEIIAGTWNQVGAHTEAIKQAEQAKFLADVQNTLRAQSLSLAGRLQMRDLTSANEQFNGFQQEMLAAAAAMDPAAGKLRAGAFREAIPEEQKALQHLLRAEATFRRIQVAFGSPGAGAGGGGSMGRDLASLSDLELDTQKNQYETAQSGSQQQQDRDVDAALHRLDELARAQEQLAQEHPPGADAAEQRWQQEMLRRNAEELRRQLEQLGRDGGAGAQTAARGSQDGGDAQGSPTGPGSKPASRSAATGSAGAPGSASGPASGREQAAQSPAVQAALARLRQAEAEMRRAGGQGDAAAAHRAADGLRAAMAALGGLARDQAVGGLDELSRRATVLAGTARTQAEQLRQLLPGGGAPNRSAVLGGDTDAMVDQRQHLADDLARLTQALRDAQREVLTHNRPAAAKLRDALAALDDEDVETRLQRSADLLRRGYNPAADSADDDIAADLAHLADQVRDARTAAANGAADAAAGDDALEGVRRFRERLAALDPARDAGGRAGGDSARGGGRADAGAPGSDATGRGTADGGPGRGTGPDEVRGAGRGLGGPVNGGWNTGNDAELPRGVGADPTPAPADRERAISQGLDELARVRRAVGDDAEARRQVDELIAAVKQLDPKRFPGNPGMVDELFAEVRSGLDRLELQLGHDPDERRDTARSAASAAVPEGYQNAVAEYYRRLSREH